MSTFSRLFGQLFFAILLVVAGAVIPARGDCLAASQVDQARTVVRTALIASGSSLAAFNTDQPLTLSFSPSALPKGAEVIDAELRLRLKDLRGNPNFRISVKLDLPTNMDFGEIEFRPGNLGKRHPAVSKANNTALIKLAVGGDSDVRLKLEAPNLRPGVQTYEWYGPGETDFSLRPRLILTYRMPGAQPREAVGLPNAISAAAFAGSTFVDFFTKPRTGLVAYPLAGQGMVVSQVPALGEGVIYMITKTALEARSSISGATLWSIPVSIPVENPKAYLVADSSDHLYVVANKAARRFRIDPRNPGAPAREDTPVDSTQAPALDPSQAPTLGPDGSLYALNNGSVIGLDPNFRALWSIPLGHNKVSPITVGPTGCFAYLVSAPGNGEGLKGLLAIDTATGDEISSDLPNQADLQSFDHPALHAPVVLLHSDGTEKVYVAADTGTNGTLDEFDKQREAAELKRGWEITGLWSQPLARPASEADKKGDWEVVGARADKAAGTAKIEIADWIDGNTKKLVDYTNINNINIEQMAASSVPIIDAAGRFYLPLSQVGGPTGLSVSLPTGPFGPLSFRDLSGAPTNRPERPFINGPERLMIGPDGALYGLFSDSRIPYAIFGTIDLANGSNVKLCGKAPLYVSGQGSSAKISAERAVILGPGTRLGGGTKISTGSCP